MKFNELKLGKSLEIILIRDEYKIRIISKIEDVADDHVSVTLIVGNGKRLIFKEDDSIDLIYKDGERLWRWTNLKGGLSVLEGTPVHSFYGKPEGESFNRRNAYRVYLGEENTFSYTKSEFGFTLTQNEEEMNDEEKAKIHTGCACIIKDLSENGAAILSNVELKKMDMIRFCLETTFGDITCIGKVVRVAKENEGIYSNFYGIQFIQVSNSITKYIFEVQRMNLKKARR